MQKYTNVHQNILLRECLQEIVDINGREESQSRTLGADLSAENRVNCKIRAFESKRIKHHLESTKISRKGINQIVAQILINKLMVFFIKTAAIYRLCQTIQDK